jgi:hypothetical protein
MIGVLEIVYQVFVQSLKVSSDQSFISGLHGFVIHNIDLYIIHDKLVVLP